MNGLSIQFCRVNRAFIVSWYGLVVGLANSHHAAETLMTSLLEGLTCADSA